MSTLPPEPPQSAPPPPPPPPAGPETAPGLPWENRAQLGFGPALVETIKLVVTAPGQAFAQMREKGDLFEALLFGVITGTAGAVVAVIWRALLPSPFAFFPGPMREKLAAMGFMAGTSLIAVIFMPVFITIFLFVYAAILHLFLMIFGALTKSQSGYEGTFRVLSYSSVADFANLVPMAGWLAALVWRIVLLTFGFTRIHRTTQGRSAAAAIAPLALCCLCSAVVLLVGVAAIGSVLFHR